MTMEAAGSCVTAAQLPRSSCWHLCLPAPTGSAQAGVSWDTAPQLGWSLCHQSLQTSPSDNLECPYLHRPQTVPIKRILDFSSSRDVIHSQQADFSLHKTYNPDPNQSKVGVVAGQPVSGGLACYFKDKSIYFSSPSSSEHLLLPVSPCPFHYCLGFRKGGALLLPENTDRSLLPGEGCEMSASRPAPMLLIQSLEPGTSIIHLTLP